MPKRRNRHARRIWAIALVAVLGVITLALVAFAMLRPIPEGQPSTYSPSAATSSAPKPLTVAFIGDSYTAGAGATDPSHGWAATLARTQGWDMTNLARGGTGYLSAVTGNAKVACGLDYCPAYPEMVKDAAAANPAIVLVAGGRNDVTRDPDQEAAAVRAFYTQLRAALPNAKIVAVSPVWDATAPPPALGAIAADVKSAVVTVGGTYLDIGQPLQGRPDLISKDGVHPDDDGHAALARAVQAKIG